MSAVFALTFTDHLPALFGIPHMLSIKNLLTIQKRTTVDENEHGTALHRAVQMGNAVMAKSLLDNRTVWVDEEDGRGELLMGRTALHYSMEQNSFEVVEALVNGGANLDCVDYHGTSACHLACREGKIDALELLMAHRADAFCVDKAGKTPFDLACEFGKEKMVEFMLMTVDNPSLLRHAGDAHKASALHLAARNGHTHIVCRLLENGWDINRTTVLGSALHEASGYGRAQVVRFLLHAGINSSLTNAAGLTALEYAKKNAHRNPITFKEIRFLLKGEFVYILHISSFIVMLFVRRMLHFIADLKISVKSQKFPRTRFLFSKGSSCVLNYDFS
ncbi:unnamed protein product [Nippostrongylus brasiliensis]|uniref:ANK_REP_REGION domain-containing protein n=1 Tax=Nippostrongylus brasiliensis TaxID=27835 RepID=A0A0N4XYZ5_NIPBR|nr:unnamed protein product [Nippostrongylus brasiliensis]